MLGFNPISSSAISGSPFRLAGTVASIAAAISFTFSASPNLTSRVAVVASGTVTFGSSGNISVLVPISAAGSFALSASPTWSALVPISGSARIQFDADAILRLAGRPFIATAIAEQFIAQASRSLFEASAIADNFTTEGGR